MEALVAQVVKERLVVELDVDRALLAAIDDAGHAAAATQPARGAGTLVSRLRAVISIAIASLPYSIKSELTDSSV